ncbi:hypothetical protein [Subtercola sp. RTI3]|uniref:hypothetical protein n=1 Tax=Subtercola sp. RTI3 TaxID=3048639 RepID=UPI002B223786|nr:hypothetical protein [Subtercola sp. RTI3]MEA9983645.1 hypothetical protein [Subtercola sp. RTI3]
MTTGDAKVAGDGTVRIIAGAVFCLLGVWGVFRLPFAVATGEGATIAGGLTSVLLFGGLGVFLLVRGLIARGKYQRPSSD